MKAFMGQDESQCRIPCQCVTVSGDEVDQRRCFSRGLLPNASRPAACKLKQAFFELKQVLDTEEGPVSQSLQLTPE
jgi:hypothetical protein